MKPEIYHLNNLAATKSLAEIISTIARPNLLILLSGTLGSGKTQLTKLIGQALGITTNIPSPTFVIWNEYLTKKGWNLIHMDAYRLNATINTNEYYELFSNKFVIIEWPEQLNINYPVFSSIKINLEIKTATKRNFSIIFNNFNNESEFKKQLAVFK